MKAAEAVAAAVMVAGMTEGEAPEVEEETEVVVLTEAECEAPDVRTAAMERVAATRAEDTRAAAPRAEARTAVARWAVAGAAVLRHTREWRQRGGQISERVVPDYWHVTLLARDIFRTIELAVRQVTTTRWHVKIICSSWRG